MSSAYVYEVPDLDLMLNRKELTEWKFFLSNASKDHKKIRWQASYYDECYTFQNFHMCNRFLSSVQLDFARKRIVFVKGALEDHEFENFLAAVLGQLFIRINANSSLFLTSAPRYRRRDRSTR